MQIAKLTANAILTVNAIVAGGDDRVTWATTLGDEVVAAFSVDTAGQHTPDAAKE
jgi:hypothetical protein